MEFGIHSYYKIYSFKLAIGKKEKGLRTEAGVD